MIPHRKIPANLRISKGERTPSIFFHRDNGRSGKPVKRNDAWLTRCDLGLLAMRESFSPAATLRVAKRCRFGAPQVLLCSPMKGSAPFPTTFWLVCPDLERRIGTLESHNAVDSMEELLRDIPERWNEYHKTHTRLRLSLMSPGRKRYLRRFRPSVFKALRRGGIGGMQYRLGDFYVKCIHLQAASYLALGRHPASRWMENALSSWECERCLCGAD